MIRFALCCSVGAALVGLSTACVNENEIIPEQLNSAIPNPPEDPNPLQEDRIVQVAQPKVDVLFVVDNSCSMSEEQQRLAANFPVFMNYFIGSGVDYHMGVTSTDMDSSAAGSSGKLKAVAGTRFISEETVNPIQVFGQMTSLGTNGFYEEKGRSAAYTTIEVKRDVPANEGFYREEASMHFIFVSDEEDQSGGNPVTRQEFIQWMRALKWAPEFTVAHGIYFIPGTSCPDSDTPGVEYNAYVNQTGGTKQNLCAQDWGPFIDELGLQTSGLKREFFLTKIPVTTPWTINVRAVIDSDSGPVNLGFDSCFAGEEVEDPDCQVTYNPGRNSVTFLNWVPDPFAEVFITYNVMENFSAGGEVIDAL